MSFALLPVSRNTYDEIAKKLETAGYNVTRTLGGKKAIILDGIAIIEENQATHNERTDDTPPAS